MTTMSDSILYLLHLEQLQVNFPIIDECSVVNYKRLNHVLLHAYL